MTIRTLAASILALGLLAPAGAMADSKNCSQEQENRRDYIDCSASVEDNTAQYGASVVSEAPRKAPIDDYVDEKSADSN